MPAGVGSSGAGRGIGVQPAVCAPCGTQPVTAAPWGEIARALEGAERMLSEAEANADLLQARHEDELCAKIFEILVREAMQFIDRAKKDGKAFFSIIWFGSPHEPYSGLPQDLALYDDLVIIGEAADGAEALEIIVRDQPERLERYMTHPDLATFRRDGWMADAA